MPPEIDENARHKAKMANRKASAGRRSRRQDRREGPADRPYRQGQGQVDGGLGPAAARDRPRLSLRRRAVRQGRLAERRARPRSSASAIRSNGTRLGEGFTWETQDRNRDVEAAERAWAKARELMANPAIRLIVLDELNIALRYDHLDIKEVVEALKARRGDQHIVVTGRNAKPELIEAADLVTEMTPVKHHFAAGVKAQEGIEF